MSSSAVEVLVPDHRDRVGESPLWHPAERALYWVDIEGRALRRWAMDSGRLQSWPTPGRLACVALHGAGGLVAAMESGLFTLRPHDDGRLDVQLVATLQHPQPGMRFNDGRCDRAGRFWAGTMVADMSAGVCAGGLYRYDVRGLSAPLVEGLYTPNGLAFSPDNATLYLSDSHPRSQKIWAASLHDDGSLGQRRPFVDMTHLPGRPDGATVDAEGCYWICANDAGRVLRFTPEGRLDRTINLPVSKPAMCSFGGPALDMLFITSIQPAAPQGDDVALAGSVFVVRPGVCGLAETPFRHD